MGFLKGIVNAIADPRLFFLLAVGALATLVWKRERVAASAVGYGVLGFLAVFFAFGSFDPNFRLIVTKPDNVPIVGLIFLLVFFVWYSMREAVLNDRRIAAGTGPIEKAESDRVWVWPDLVYTELISLILCSVVLIIWSIFLKAPLEQPANPANTPNPSKAPWYFLGLQEMLVYFDPWLAGVVLPSLIIVGLICIPYIDKNPKGNGYFTFAERKVEITLFLFGFAVLWASLIVLGTFLRGPNWNFFGPFEFWDIQRVPLGAADVLAAPRDFRHRAGHPVRVRPAGVPGPEMVQRLLREAWPGALLRDGVPVPHDDGASYQDAGALAVQPQVHRGHSGILLQHLTSWLKRRVSGTLTTSTS